MTGFSLTRPRSATLPISAKPDYRARHAAGRSAKLSWRRVMYLARHAARQ